MNQPRASLRSTPSTKHHHVGRAQLGRRAQRPPGRLGQLDVGVDVRRCSRRPGPSSSAPPAQAVAHGSQASTCTETVTGRPAPRWRGAGVLADLEAHRDPLGQRAHVGDHADHPVAPGGQVLQGRRDHVEGGRVEGAEALVQHDRLQAGRAGRHPGQLLGQGQRQGQRGLERLAAGQGAHRPAQRRRRGGRPRRTRPCRGPARTGRRTAPAGSATPPSTSRSSASSSSQRSNLSARR